MSEDDKKINDLEKIIKWSFEHKKTWLSLCQMWEWNMDHCITMADFEELLSEIKHHGFMGLYYLLLNWYANVTEMYITNPKFPEFIQNCVSVDFDIDIAGMLKK